MIRIDRVLKILWILLFLVYGESEIYRNKIPLRIPICLIKRTTARPGSCFFIYLIFFLAFTATFSQFPVFSKALGIKKSKFI